jgi:hypothetical protein
VTAPIVPTASYEAVLSALATLPIFLSTSVASWMEPLGIRGAVWLVTLAVLGRLERCPRRNLDATSTSECAGTRLQGVTFAPSSASRTSLPPPAWRRRTSKVTDLELAFTRVDSRPARALLRSFLASSHDLIVLSNESGSLVRSLTRFRATSLTWPSVGDELDVRPHAHRLLLGRCWARYSSAVSELRLAEDLVEA